MIADCFDRSWRMGEIPEDWKKANVTSVFKQDKKEEPGNYTPISINSVPEKVMGHIILDAISKQMKEKNVIRSSRHESTKRKSCLTSLVAFYDIITH